MQHQLNKDYTSFPKKLLAIWIATIAIIGSAIYASLQEPHIRSLSYEYLWDNAWIHYLGSFILTAVITKYSIEAGLGKKKENEEEVDFEVSLRRKKLTSTFFFSIWISIILFPTIISDAQPLILYGNPTDLIENKISDTSLYINLESFSLSPEQIKFDNTYNGDYEDDSDSLKGYNLYTRALAILYSDPFQNKQVVLRFSEPSKAYIPIEKKTESIRAKIISDMENNLLDSLTSLSFTNKTFRITKEVSQPNEGREAAIDLIHNLESAPHEYILIEPVDLAMRYNLAWVIGIPFLVLTLLSFPIILLSTHFLLKKSRIPHSSQRDLTLQNYESFRKGRIISLVSLGFVGTVGLPYFIGLELYLTALIGYGLFVLIVFSIQIYTLDQYAIKKLIPQIFKTYFPRLNYQAKFEISKESFKSKAHFMDFLSFTHQHHFISSDMLCYIGQTYTHSSSTGKRLIFGGLCIEFDIESHTNFFIQSDRQNSIPRFTQSELKKIEDAAPNDFDKFYKGLSSSNHGLTSNQIKLLLRLQLNVLRLAKIWYHQNLANLVGPHLTIYTKNKRLYAFLKCGDEVLTPKLFQSIANKNFRFKLVEELFETLSELRRSLN